jgi:hypothetical protein
MGRCLAGPESPCRLRPFGLRKTLVLAQLRRADCVDLLQQDDRRALAETVVVGDSRSLFASYGRGWQRRPLVPTA